LAKRRESVPFAWTWFKVSDPTVHVSRGAAAHSYGREAEGGLGSKVSSRKK